MIAPIPDLGIGILSWRGHDSLARVLPTYTAHGLFDFAVENVLVLPEPEAQTVALGKVYGLRVETVSENLGILGGHKAVAERLGTPLVLLLEDDCPLIEPRAEVDRQLTRAGKAVREGDVEIFRLRHRHFPGMGSRFAVVEKFHRYWPADGASPLRRALAATRRRLRARKAERVLGTVLYEESDPYADPYALSQTAGTGHAPPSPAPRRPDPPDRLAPDRISLHPDGYYRVSPKALPWSNQSILLRRDFFLETIIPYAEAHPSTRPVNGFPDLERELNRTAFWEASGWHIGVGRGLFSHELP